MTKTRTGRRRGQAHRVVAGDGDEVEMPLPMFAWLDEVASTTTSTRCASMPGAKCLESDDGARPHCAVRAQIKKEHAV